MANESKCELELGDIQSGALRPRSRPYAATCIGLRIDDRKAGRDLMGRAVGVVNSAADAASHTGDAWVSIALTCEGLKALQRYGLVGSDSGGIFQSLDAVVAPPATKISAPSL